MQYTHCSYIGLYWLLVNKLDNSEAYRMISCIITRAFSWWILSRTRTHWANSWTPYLHKETFACYIREAASLDVFYSADINECLDDTLNCCEQVCVNTNGSHYCDCDEGYELNSNSCTCDGK